jgi:endonuclease/exonuclease/phosphatase family metal-dependent hydrolase
MKKTVFLTAFLLVCSPAPTETLKTPPQSHTVTIMTFNVENLFDNNDDEGKDDRTYFPLEVKQTDEHKKACAEITVERWRDKCLYWDWSDNIIEHKLRVVAKAILQVNDGRGADIIALQEVENISILERLRTEYLSDANYLPAILIEGNDFRGIDVAFLTRLELANEPVLHKIPFTGFDEKRVADTRGILQADFTLPDGSILTGFAVHFPAPHQPTGMRVAAYAHLSQLKADLPAGRPAFAAGDFNTTAEEDRNKNMLERHARPWWTVVHELGCGGCKGTYYYRPTDDWSFLDMILWSPGEPSGAQATWKLHSNPYYVANQGPDQVLENGTPARFSLPEGTGVSDHWPLVATIQSTKNNAL